MAKKAAKEKTAPKTKPRQAELIPDSRIVELEHAAESYAEIRDQRIALNQAESQLKTKLLGLMKKHKKRHYQRGNLEIEIIVEAEKVKVRTTKPED